MHFQEAAKYVTETRQPAVYAIAEINKNWFDSLPTDLQKIVDNDAAKEQAALTPVAIEIVDKSRNRECGTPRGQHRFFWREHVPSGGVFSSLPPVRRMAS